MRTEVITILGELLAAVEDANHKLGRDPVNGFEPYVKARVEAQIEAAEAIHKIYEGLAEKVQDTFLGKE